MSSQNPGLALGRAAAKANPITGSVFTLSGLNGGAAKQTQRREPLTEQDLPPSSTQRWVMRRKAVVVAAVQCGLITLEEACRRYTLSVEEFHSWQRLIDSHGVRGLRATRLKEYRSDGNDGSSPL